MNAQQTAIEREVDQLEADLPGLDRFVSGAAYSFARLTRSVKNLSSAYESESKLVMKILDGHDYGVLGDEANIPRITGLRRTSVSWSVLEVVDHLNQYQDFLLRCLADLVGDNDPLDGYRYFVPGTNDESGAELFRENAWHFVSTVNNLVEKARLQQAAGTVFHPLFGRVDAKGLVVIAWQHLRLHRRQMQKILAEEGVA